MCQYSIVVFLKIYIPKKLKDKKNWIALGFEIPSDSEVWFWNSYGDGDDSDADNISNTNDED